MVNPSMGEQPSPISHSPEHTQQSTNAADPPVLHYHIHKFHESLCEPRWLCFPALMQSCPWTGSNMNGLGAEAMSVWISADSTNIHIYFIGTNTAPHLGLEFCYLGRVKQKSQSKLHMEPSCSYTKECAYLPTAHQLTSHLVGAT